MIVQSLIKNSILVVSPYPNSKDHIPLRFQPGEKIEVEGNEPGVLMAIKSGALRVVGAPAVIPAQPIQKQIIQPVAPPLVTPKQSLPTSKPKVVRKPRPIQQKMQIHALAKELGMTVKELARLAKIELDIDKRLTSLSWIDGPQVTQLKTALKGLVD